LLVFSDELAQLGISDIKFQGVFAARTRWGSERDNGDSLDVCEAHHRRCIAAVVAMEIAVANGNYELRACHSRAAAGWRAAEAS
jgi:hypothetical protein